MLKGSVHTVNSRKGDRRPDMKYILTIDTGTTNTRMVLWKNKREPVRSVQTGIGVKSTAIDGTNRKLKAGIRQCMEQILDIFLPRE